jgi:hypothetical protein
MLAETRADPTPDTTRLSELSAEPENSHGAGRAHQTLRGSWRQASNVAASDTVGLRRSQRVDATLTPAGEGVLYVKGHQTVFELD